MFDPSTFPVFEVGERVQVYDELDTLHVDPIPTRITDVTESAPWAYEVDLYGPGYLVPQRDVEEV